jgi:hypothetical protein
VLMRPTSRISLSRDRYVGVNRMDQAGTSLKPESLVLWNGEVRHAIASERLNFQLAVRDDSPGGGAAAGGTVARKEYRRGNTR